MAFIKSTSASALEGLNSTVTEIGGLFDKLRKKTSSDEGSSISGSSSSIVPHALSSLFTPDEERKTLVETMEEGQPQGDLRQHNGSGTPSSTSLSATTESSSTNVTSAKSGDTVSEAEDASEHIDVALVDNHSTPTSDRSSLGNSHEKLAGKCPEDFYDINRQSANDSGGGKSSTSRSVEKKKKGNTWYNVLSPTYKSKSEDLKKLFKDVPNDERLIVDYSCALQRDILTHGRLYITQNWICFYAKIFGWETAITIRCKDITSMTKEKTARVIPNAIQIISNNEKYFFTSFGARDKSYLMMFRVWQNALMDQPMTAQEMWQWVHLSYGDELGLTSSDDDYIPPEEETPNTFISKDALDEGGEEKTDNPEDLMGKISPTDAVSMTTTSNEDLYDRLAPPSQNGLINLGMVKAASFDNPDMPTDFSDDSEETEGDVVCTCSEHRGMKIIDEVYNISVDQMYEMLFTDSKFFRDLLDRRKTFDLVLTPWPDDADRDGTKMRMISYTLTLNAAFGPKTSPATEKQLWLPESRPGAMYRIECECINSAIPYGDSFYVVNQYCITRVHPHRCRLLVHSEIRYRKNVWGLVKNIIDKNCTAGIKDYFKTLVQCLREESERPGAPFNIEPTPSKKRVRRRRRAHSRASEVPAATSTVETNHITVPSPVSAPGTDLDKFMKTDVESMVKLLAVVLSVLLLFNAMLFYKMWTLEGVASNLYIGDTEEELAHLSSYPKSQEQWVKLLRQQQHLHDAEIDKWKSILDTSVLLLGEMKSNLEVLQQSLSARYSSKVDQPA
ncbi:GRAM domain-containing protein 1B isoform X2 [Lingula anatina]|uniref:GRAM domain-containing protein 1B isoform X2 n=1 Tax=Lingula anatina TaxID=7574 RepID=A0A1S3JZQ0_LINAN|nr:GRAM domain-containing protein 1B isoform X2 [Lingula anatina]|eukprot:XP_013415579.2 GRAM domain-containing protein 1B isoform X2 [Lingula anatina]